MKIKCWLIYFLVALTLTPEIALAQGTLPSNWTVLEHLSRADRLFVELKSGMIVSGNFYGIGDTTLMLSSNNKPRDLNRNDIRKIYRDLGKSVGRTTLKGTLVGGAISAAAGGIFPPVFFPKQIYVVTGKAVFGAFGATAGLVIGAVRHHRELIYQA